MRPLLFLALLLGVISCKPKSADTGAASTPASSENKVLYFVLTPKLGMEQAFESKMADFAKAHFKDDMVFRVMRAYGGENDGSYVMTRSKMTTWGFYDSTTATADSFWTSFDQSVMPTLESMQMDFIVFQPALSSTAQSAYAEKMTVTERVVKPGYVQEFEASMKKLVEVWRKLGVHTAAYRNSTGNLNRFVFVRRHPKGWAEKDDATQVRNAFVEMYSQAEWDKFYKENARTLEHTHSWLQYYRKDLSNE